MIIRHIHSLLLTLTTSVFLGLVCIPGAVDSGNGNGNGVWAAGPTSRVSSFKNSPARLFFFEDTAVAIYFDRKEGTIHVSRDEGKIWERAKDIPLGEAAMFIEHPFEKDIAFVLTKSTTHYRTTDRAKTWQKFTLPLPPSRKTLKPLNFHSDPKKFGYVLYEGEECVAEGWSWRCVDTTFYTKDAFGDEPRKLLEDTSRCQFAHSTKQFKHSAHSDLIYCVASQSSSSSSSLLDKRQSSNRLASSRLFSSTDFFDKEKKHEDLGLPARQARGVLALAIVSKFAVVAIKDVSSSSSGGSSASGGGGGDLSFYVSTDTKTWSKSHFPHASSAKLHENAYTIVANTAHSLAVDVVMQSSSSSSPSSPSPPSVQLGTLFVSDSEGREFVESLRDTNRNEWGFVDYEGVYGVEGVSLANVVANGDEVRAGREVEKEVRSLITFDDGSSWETLTPPSTSSTDKPYPCSSTTNPKDDCSLHLHSLTTPHNFGRTFSSPAPGFLIGVGSVGKYLAPYSECSTFMSRDAGVTWREVLDLPMVHAFGDKGGIILLVGSEHGGRGETDVVRWSTDEGKSWREYRLSVRVTPVVLLGAPDSTSQKFMLVGQVGRKVMEKEGYDGRYVVVYIDFADVRSRKCTDDDFERWDARSKKGSECLMGHKQWYMRRKPDADCFVGDKFDDPVEHEENCECTDADYECDFNFIRNGDKCDPVGPEPIPNDVCRNPEDTYMGSSGWRKIPGDTCVGGKKKDEKVEKSCRGAKPAEGSVVHQTFEFPAGVKQYAYFNQSSTILVRTEDHAIYQSRNEGYTWQRIAPSDQFLAFYHHTTTPDRAYLITNTKRIHYTTDFGAKWSWLEAPTFPNTFGASVLSFGQQSDNLIWVGNSEGCQDRGKGECFAEASYSTDNGGHWHPLDTYVRNCAWARDKHTPNHDPARIICESYKVKNGDQRKFGAENPLQLVWGGEYLRQREVVFESVVGFTKFSEFLIVAQLLEQRSLDLQVSVNGRSFAQGAFPPSMHPETHAYTVLESSTNSVFLHMTMSEWPSPYWGNILKSNSNGTYYTLSVPHVNRNPQGYVDFEKVVGLDGIAMVNVVGNTEEAKVSGVKRLRTLVTFNDGGSWRGVSAPRVDSVGREYECDTTECSLHIHGYTERFDPRATFSSPSAVGVLMGVGNVGTHLLPYTSSDTFLSRDAGHTWVEVRKDAHLWEFGDSGSILIMANDEEETDHVVWSTDQGLSWREYRFVGEGERKVRVRSIVGVPMDTSRRFVLFGQLGGGGGRWVAVHVDFSQVLTRQCVLNAENAGQDDFELWSPSEERTERCLFGRQTMYHRRLQKAECYVGEQPEKLYGKIQKNCACSHVDFECEFNHERDADGHCVLAPNLTPLPDDPHTQCSAPSATHWYSRTAYRKIPISSCEGGNLLDRGTPHECPGLAGHSAGFWWVMIVLPFGIAGLAGVWYRRKGGGAGMGRGGIRLPGDGSRSIYGNGVGGGARDGGWVDTVASVPYFLVGVAGVVWENVTSAVERWSGRGRGGGGGGFRRGYRHLSADEDAQILRFEDEE